MNAYKSTHTGHGYWKRWQSSVLRILGLAVCLELYGLPGQGAQLVVVEGGGALTACPVEPAGTPRLQSRTALMIFVIG